MFTEEEQLQMYNNQLNVIENAMIEAKKVGDIARLYQLLAQKEQVAMAVNWLENKKYMVAQAEREKQSLVVIEANG